MRDLPGGRPVERPVYTPIIGGESENVKMKEIRLDTLTLSNFKGCEQLTLDFQGRSTDIFGDNATGKSTIYDAFIWLLFGKDAAGRSDYEIKPLGPDGQVLDHSAVTTVEAVLAVDGVSICLRKSYMERWSTKRGSAEASFDGHTSEYAMDGVPLKKGEYEARIRDLVDETAFRMLTSVTYFCQDLPWRDRRDTLFTLAGLPDDQAIMGTDPRFAELSAAMGPLSLDDFKKKLTAERKGLTATRNSIPARIDEQKKVTAELAQVDFDAIRSRQSEAAARKEDLQAQALQMTHGTLLEQKRAELAGAKNRMAALMNENNAHRQSQMVPAEDKRPAMQAELDHVRRELLRWDSMSASEEDLIRRNELQIDGCRREWADIDSRSFTGGICPTCGQQLPPEAYAAALADFTRRKEREKQMTVDRADALKSAVALSKDRLKKYGEERQAAEHAVADLTARLKSYQPEAQPEIQNLPDFQARYEELDRETRDIEAMIDALQSQTSQAEADLHREISNVNGELRRLEEQLAQESVLAFAKSRIDVLMADAKKAAEEMARTEKMLYLCEEFSRFKVSFVEGSINSRFKLAQWKLFQEQINGGLADCCEATYDGVPFTALNSGARINLGLDVIRTLSAYYGLRVPLMIDNAESVTRLLPADTQVIRLVVSENDKELRVNYEN